MGIARNTRRLAQKAGIAIPPPAGVPEVFRGVTLIIPGRLVEQLRRRHETAVKDMPDFGMFLVALLGAGAEVFDEAEQKEAVKGRLVLTPDEVSGLPTVAGKRS